MTGTFSSSQFMPFTFNDFMLKVPMPAQKPYRSYRATVIEPAQRLTDAMTEEETK